MVEAKSDSKVKKIVFKALKAIIKGAIVYGIYILVWMFLSPISEYVPELQLMIEAFIIVYISLMIIEEIASGTVFKYFFNLAKSLFVIGYLIFSLKNGVFGITFQKVSITIDLRLFLTIAMLLSLLGLSKSVLQAVNYMSERAEVERI
jgi:hypothetical protein